jgi:type IV pilus assembly protein PilM
MLIIEIRDNALSIIRAESRLKAYTFKESKIIEFDESWKSFISHPEQALSLTQTIHSFQEDKVLLCLNTSSVIYRDMIVPKASPRYLDSMIRHELKNALNLSNEYLMDYAILGDTIKDDKKMQKIMVSAVLASTINEIVEFLEKANLSIISIDVSLNSLQKYINITKLLNKDKNTLVADIGSSSIRQYLFEKGKYSYYRTTKIAALSDVDEKLSIQTSVDNIEKMIQFSLSLGQNSAIDQIILFGSYTKIETLKEQLSEQLSLETSILSAPSLLTNTKNFEFKTDLVYGLGALFSRKHRRKKDINLINAYNTFYSRSSNTINFDAIYNSLAFGLGYAALFAVIIATIQTNIVNSNIKKINTHLTRPDIVSALANIAQLKANIASLNEITSELDSIQKVLDSIPRYNNLKIIDLLTVKPSTIKMERISFNNNIITLSISTADPSLIHEYVLALSDVSSFSQVTYTSYQYDSGLTPYISDINLTLNGEESNENN